MNAVNKVDRAAQNQQMAALFKGLSTTKHLESQTISEAMKAYVKLKIEEHQKDVI